MTPNTKKLFINLGIFVVLLESWWAIGMFVVSKAENHVGEQFQIPYLSNQYYNDWLPVIIAIAYSVGWGIALLVMRKNKSLLSLRWFLLISIPPLLYLLTLIAVRSVNRAFANDLMDPSLSPFQYGIISGSIFAVLQNMKKDLDG